MGSNNEKNWVENSRDTLPSCRSLNSEQIFSNFKIKIFTTISFEKYRFSAQFFPIAEGLILFFLETFDISQ